MNGILIERVKMFNNLLWFIGGIIFIILVRRVYTWIEDEQDDNEEDIEEEVKL